MASSLATKLAVAVAVAVSLPAAASGGTDRCASGTVFPGQCFKAPTAVISTIADLPSPAECCRQCTLYRGCASYTYWVPSSASSASSSTSSTAASPYLCRLYKPNEAKPVPCLSKNGTSGVLGPAPPSPPPPPPPPPPVPPPKGAPNVLFIAVDDLRPQAGCYGHADTFTPHLDRFAKTGLLFENAHAQIAHCSPSRNSLMSGRTPDRVQTWNFINDFREASVGGVGIESLPEYFLRHGFHTFGTGKVFHPNLPPHNDQARSWSEPYGEPSRASTCRRYKDGHPSNYACLPNTTADDGVADVATAKLRQLVAEGITAEAGRPFFVAAGIHKPHLPYFYPPQYGAQYPPESETRIPPPEVLRVPTGMPPVAWMACMGIYGEEPNFIDFNSLNITQHQPVSEALVRNVTRGYMASASYVDAQVGRILDTLEELGQANDTIVALWGDHGQNLGHANTWCKMTLFESATHVPLIIRDPRRAASHGARTDSPAQLLDMYPTLAALAGLPPPGTAAVDGVDLSPLFADPARTDVSSAAFSQQARCYQKNAPTSNPTPFQQTLTRMTTCEFVPRTEMDFMGYSMRTRSFRYTEWARWNGTALAPIWGDNHGVELYDHRPEGPSGAAPFSEWQETANMAHNASYAAIVKSLSASLRAYFDAAAAKPHRLG